MVDIKISNFRVRETRIGYANYTDKRHHGVRDDLLASNWVI